jgi:LCP family protein required for cell wall assembly
MATTTSPTPATAPRRRRFTRGQRVVLWILGLAILVVGLALAALVVAESRMQDAGALPALADDGGVWLVVGSDSREFLPDDLDGSFGSFTGSRADVVMLVQATNDRRQVISLPRDLKVEIPGNGTNRINAAYAFGGPNLLVQTVAGATGIRPAHYLEVGFGGFAAIVDALGGIELDVPYPSRDLKSGLDIPAGRQTIDGATALAYVRSRSLEELRDGEWVAAGGGDIARTGRQREVLLQIIDKASSPLGLLRAPRAALSATSYLTADSGTGVGDLARLAWGMQTASTTEATALPVRISNEGGVSYVVRVEPDATTMLQAFSDGRPLPAG